MFDATGAFTKQFTPTAGGYLYYPSKKAGGKLVTVEEYEALAFNWQRVAGRRGTWRVAGLVALALLFWALVSSALAFPEWTDEIVIAACVAVLVSWIGWASYAPRRLVSGRPDIAPPRLITEVRREIRRMFNWPLIMFALFFTGAMFVAGLSSLPGTILNWAWAIGSGSLFATYLWTAFKKLTD
ncbi:MAG: hypothetical protein ABIO43_10675 [Sphingomicrobium sp.]